MKMMNRNCCYEKFHLVFPFVYRISVDDIPTLTVPTPDTSFWEHGNFTGQNVWAGAGKNAPFDQPVCT